MASASPSVGPLFNWGIVVGPSAEASLSRALIKAFVSPSPRTSPTDGGSFAPDMSSPRYPAIAPIKTGNSGPRRKKMNALEKITAVKSRRALTKTARSNSFMALPRFAEPHPFRVALLRQRARRTRRADQAVLRRAPLYLHPLASELSEAVPRHLGRAPCREKE